MTLSNRRFPVLQATLGLWVLTLVAHIAPELQGAEAAELLVPQGYAVEKVAGVPEVRFPMFGALDERGRLFVAESSGLDLYAELRKLSRTCRVSVLEDEKGEGRYETARVFVDGLVFPMGLAWHAGRLYVADPPHVVAFEDTDGDGRADKRTVILGEFGHLDNGSLHGLIFGPDGWLYLTMGQPDGYRFTRPDGTVISGKSGALIRCRPDGSEVEVISRGFENLVEVDFAPTGEVIGTDNWFSLPVAGVRDALVHLVEGGLYPTCLRDDGSPMLQSGEPLPCIAFYPAVAFSGFVRYRGTGFPREVVGDFFSAQHNTRKIVRHHFERAGATFQSTDVDFVTTLDPDFHPSDVLEDADGSLLVIDTGSWYIHHCPTGRIRNVPAPGGIFRVRSAIAGPSKDARGQSLDWISPPASELAKRLLDPRPVVQDRAAELLSAQGAETLRALGPMAGAALPSSGAEKVVWTLARVPGGTGALLPVLQHPDPERVAMAARALGRIGSAEAGPQLVPLLQHAAAHVRLAAAEALAHCGGRAQLTAVIDGLAANQDRFIAHSLIHVLYRFATRADLLAALDHTDPKVQRAALVLLDQPPHNALPPAAAVDRLFAAHPPLRSAARTALGRHPDWIARVLPALRQIASFSHPAQADLTMLAEAALAFRTNAALAQFVAEALDPNAAVASSTRSVLLEAIGQLPGTQVPASWVEALRHLLSSLVPDQQLQATRTARAFQLPALDAALADLARDPARPADLRIEALGAVVRRSPALGDAEAALLLDRLSPTHAPNLRLGAAEILGQAQLAAKPLVHFVRSAKADPLIAASVVLAAAQRSPEAGQAAGELVEYVKAALSAGAPVSAETIRWLEGISPKALKADLGALRQLSGQRDERQRAQLEQIAPLLQGGDPNRGHELFLAKATCATCHRVGQHGGWVGPDLTKVGAIRSGRDLVESLVAPSATFAQGYEPYIVNLQNGDSLSGVRVRQPNDLFVLREAGGVEVRLEPAQIQSVRQSQTSTMPEGLLTVLNQNEIRDLLAYLQSLK